jgi:hypothetical protein
MRSLGRVSVVLSCWLVTACAGPGASSTPSFEVPTYADVGAAPAALITGTLERDGACVTVRGPSGPRVLVWPPGTTARLDTAGVIVTEVDGSQYREHGLYAFSGGEYTVADFPQAIAGLANGCRSSQLWYVGPEHPALSP